MTEAKEHEVVKTKDGREGTVVHVYRGSFAYEVEYDEGEVETVYPEDVVKVVWRLGDPPR